MNNRRVVVTGLGSVTPVGNNLHEYWDGLLSGRNGVELITKFDTTNFDTKFAAEVKNFDPGLYVDFKNLKRIDTFSVYALASATQAWDDAAFPEGSYDPERFGVIFGSGIGGLKSLENQFQVFYNDNSPKKLSPFFVTMMIADIAGGHISIKYGLKGPNYSTTSACATSSHAIADAFMLIQRGAADAMICGGAEAAATELGIGGFGAMRAISTWNDRYKEASRPFDKDRNGFVLGEGSGSVILEEYEHAKRRGAKIYAELAGIGLTGDAYHMTAPDPEGSGAVRAMEEALRDAGVPLEKIDYINAHGTSTPLNDKTETKAIKTVFGGHAYNLAISSIKSMTGHLLGAAGAIEAVATIMTIGNDIIPPTINLDEADPECDLYYVPKQAVKRKVDFAISNTFGFGGHNASLLFKKLEA
ncbi:MAG: beta-ketoacyl-ACP synthase II [Bacteroidetes bacterium]|nr:beta-ketoacyl-ACP synthase II [Bacteroidota bacterium]